jgi:alpha-beta hydrolase superfamily lysophospholipase
VIKLGLSIETFVQGKDGMDIFLRIWDDVLNPKGVVQIFHGMAEHTARYDDFARFLNEKGYIVYADDHRGHGYSADKNNILGYVGENGFYNIVEDEKIISELIKEKHKNLPLYIFAHSFGSFIGQEYIIRYSKDINGIILSGSAKQNGLDIKAGNILSNIQNKFFDNTLEAKLINKLSFGSFNNKVENKRTEFDWLSRDDKEVDKYIKDELCGYISPINFYYNLFEGFKGLYKRARLDNVVKTLPILVLSGDMDPVGKYGKSVKRLYNQYNDLDIQDISLKLYPGGRHELLNEENKEEVYDYIYNWLKGR